MEPDELVHALFDGTALTITFGCRRCGTRAVEDDLTQDALTRRLGAFVTVHRTCRPAWL